jgi:hypothetical protein
VQIQLNTRTVEADHRIQMEFPPEEALESLAARLRPLILDSEDIHYSKVFDAIEDLVGADKLDEIVDVQWWRAFWSEPVDGSLAAQAYYMTTDNGHRDRSPADVFVAVLRFGARQGDPVAGDPGLVYRSAVSGRGGRDRPHRRVRHRDICDGQAPRRRGVDRGRSACVHPTGGGPPRSAWIGPAGCTTPSSARRYRPTWGIWIRRCGGPYTRTWPCLCPTMLHRQPTALTSSDGFDPVGEASSAQKK